MVITLSGFAIGSEGGGGSKEDAKLNSAQDEVSTDVCRAGEDVSVEVAREALHTTATGSRGATTPHHKQHSSA